MQQEMNGLIADMRVLTERLSQVRLEDRSPVLRDLAAKGYMVSQKQSLRDLCASSSDATLIVLKHLEAGAGYLENTRYVLADALAVKSATPFWSRLKCLYSAETGHWVRQVSTTVQLCVGFVG